MTDRPGESVDDDLARNIARTLGWVETPDDDEDQETDLLPQWLVEWLIQNAE